jgi:hypothetical protein
MEEWSITETDLFEEAMKKYGKGNKNIPVECGGNGSSWYSVADMDQVEEWTITEEAMEKYGKVL